MFLPPRGQRRLSARLAAFLLQARLDEPEDCFPAKCKDLGEQRLDKPQPSGFVHKG